MNFVPSMTQTKSKLNVTRLKKKKFFTKVRTVSLKVNYLATVYVYKSK